MTSERLRRRRRKVDYADNGGDDDGDGSDNDFITNTRKNLKKPHKDKTLEKSEKNQLPDVDSSIPIQKPFTANSLGFGNCLNLSEDESSDDDDDNIPIANLKTSQQLQQLLPTDLPHKSEEKLEIGKRKASQSAYNCSVPLKKVKVGIAATKSMKCDTVSERSKIEYFEVCYEEKNEDFCFSSEESEAEWQEVDEMKLKSPKKKKIKKEVMKEERQMEPIVKDLQISVGVQSIHKKKKKTSREEKMFIWMRQIAGRILKQRQILFHKCHLLCLFSKCLHENEICNNNLLQGLFLSLIPEQFIETSTRLKTWGMPRITTFLAWFQKEIPDIAELLLFIDKSAESIRCLQRIHVFVMMFRALGFPARLVFSLQPVSHKIKDEITAKTKPLKDGKGLKHKNKEKDETDKVISPYFKSPNKLNTKHSNNTQKAKTKTTVNLKKFTSKNVNKQSTKTIEKKCSNRKTKTVDYQEESFDNEDDDFEAKPLKQKTPQSSSRQSKQISRKCSDNKLNISQTDSWCEIYLESMQSWINVELATNTINKPEKCEKIATKPLQYVIAIDNGEKVKDVTCRYAEKWLSHNRKLRPDREWWAATVEPYKPNKSIIDDSEDAKLKKNLLNQDFPKSISEFKNHPLYALQRHLLKFEAIYPPDAAPLGYLRKEAIYSRDFVYELHTRETWMKQARTVKLGEHPYKLVKGRPKRNTPEHERDDIKVEVFGLWQTEIYVPPPVKDGKVPKNEYGNVELFQASMLPEGAVHLPMNNMQKIARKLNIDYAPAMMGWDFHGGWSHPVFEGIVVATEFEDILLDAWRQDDEDVKRKEEEKLEKSIYENWKKLIKGILIHHKLKSKYNFDDGDEDEEVDNHAESKGPSTAQQQQPNTSKHSTIKNNKKTKKNVKSNDEKM